MVQAAGPTSTSKDYSVAVFANAPSGFTNPDSITSFQGTIWVGYQNKTLATGGGGNSNIVQFDPSGQVMKVYTLADKTDGLKFNPFDGKIYALQNEDANPHLVLIDPVTGTMTNFNYSAAPAHGGGYDDIVFLNGQIFISASNPTVDANGQNNFPSVVKATLNGNQIDVTPVLIGNAKLTDIASGNPFVSLQSDPDSLKVDPSGNLVLDSQADGNLIFLNAPGSPNQVGYVLQLSSSSTTQVAVDDTVFPTAASGTIYVADTPANIVYAVTSNVFPPNSAFTSATDSASYVGRIDLQTGAITAIITGLQGPHGALFLSSLPEVRLDQVSSSGGKPGGLAGEFLVSRTGDVSQALQVVLNVTDSASKDPSSSTTQTTVTIPAGASSAKVKVRLDSKNDLTEDHKQSVVVSIEPNSHYNVQPNNVETGVQVLSLPLPK
jgi:sugar lactone lactonase YvrE